MKIILNLCWWLWNQMFQYAFGRKLSIPNKSELILNNKLWNIWKKDVYRSVELNNFCIKWSFSDTYNSWFSYSLIDLIKFSLKKLFWLFPYKIIQERNLLDIIKDKIWLKWKWFRYKKIVLNTKKDNYFIWFWQSYKYFESIKDIIQKDFQPKEKMDERNSDFISQFYDNTTVSLHVRRWDYSDWYHWFCSLEYYQKAIVYIKQKQKDSDLIFIIFSNDIAWCKQEFGEEKFYYVDWNTWKNSYRDMILMSKCKHNIIANSSFSWRWAYLNQNQNQNKIVIAPRNWFNVPLDTKDLLPPERVKL